MVQLKRENDIDYSKAHSKKNVLYRVFDGNAQGAYLMQVRPNHTAANS